MNLVIPMNREKKLTKKQEKILIYIKKYIAKNDFPPTIREIGKGINLSSPATVHAHLKNLIEKGYIRRNPTNNRIIDLLVPNEFIPKVSDTINIPLISNTLKPTTINIPKSFSQDKELFAFQIDEQNTFLTNTEKNDIIIFEKTSTFNNEDLLLIKLDENYLLRHITKEGNIYNVYKDTIEEKEERTIITILGRPLLLYRKF